MVLFFVMIISFSYAESTTFAEAFPNTAKNGQLNEDKEEREWDWIGVVGILGILGLRRNKKAL